MITVRLHSRVKETELALLIAGETMGRVYVNYPIKGHTRKLYKQNKYLITNGTI